MAIPLTIDPSVEDLAVGLVQVGGVQIAPPGEQLVEHCRAACTAVAAHGPEGGDERRQAVRRLLRRGGFKPSGRNKPAQEYLLRAAGADGQWPTILNVVDVLNVVSLESGLPISLVALNRLQLPLVIRYGRPEEAYVFNAAGQELKLAGLFCICQTVDGATQPVGSPVKDSLLAKVTPEDDRVLACIFAPRSAVTAQQLAFWTNELAAGIEQWCSPENVATERIGIDA
jgi:DNA/RNA-binding domain of Phe-tRNA-synthetase-like protein